VLVATTDNKVDILVISGDLSDEQIDRPASRYIPGHRQVGDVFEFSTQRGERRVHGR